MKKITAAFLLSTTFAASAFAADQGWYAGASLGQSSTDTFVLRTKTGNSFAVFGGYQFMKYIAAELQYTDFGGIDFYNAAGVKITGWHAAAVPMYPFNDQWTVMGKLGYANTKLGSPDNSSKSDLMYGVGGQYNINMNWGIRANYDLFRTVSGVTAVPPQQKATTTLLSVSGVYKF